MAEFTTAELKALKAGLPRFGVFVALLAEPAAYWWGGVGKIRPGVNRVDETGQTYKGFGELTDIDDLLNVFDGSASRIALTVSQVPINVFGAVAPQIAEQQAAIQGKEIYIGWVAMDSDWQPLGPVRWEWPGFADSLTVNHRASSTANGPAGWALTLSCGDWLTGIRRPGLSFMADNDQRARALLLNPAARPDRFCERTGRYSIGTEKPLPVNA
jgi:hypothetical protein